MKYADIHTHPFLFPYNRNKKINDIVYKKNPLSNKLINLVIKHTDVYKSQSNIYQLAQGNVKCVFISITPMEREYYIGRDFSLGVKGIKKYLAKIGTKATGKKSPLKIISAMKASSFPISRIKTFQSDRYDYFREFKKEMKFCLDSNGKVLVYKKDQNKKIKIRYSLTRNFNEVREILSLKDKSYKHIAFILTCEGAHLLTGGNRRYKVKLETILKRVDYLKNKLPYPVFFMTLGHIFYNGLCGICRSLPANSYWLGDQEYGMNREITNEGDIVIKRLLNLDGKDKRRILIDVNHMSLKARMEYYGKYIIPYNEKHEDNKIPTIASHTAYSGIESFREMKKIADRELKDICVGKGKFPCETHNLTGDDIRIINDSEGLIGLILSKRFLASRKRIKEMKDKKSPYEWGLILADNIKYMINAMLKSDKMNSRKKKKQVWDRICIGSDFDGFGETPEVCRSADEFPQMERILLNVIKRDKEFNKILLGFDAEEVVEKIMFRNAYEFLKRHFK